MAYSRANHHGWFVNQSGREFVMSCFKHLVLAVLWVSATACVSASGNESESANEQDLGGREPQLLQNWNTTGDLKFDNDSADIAPRVDCAFIDWCNRPASISPDIGTVCRVRTGCTLTQAVVNECTSDAIAVCGGMVQPAFICRQGASCP
jgi:hypothetical protein